MTVTTLNATTNTQVLAHLQALTLCWGVSPVYVPGTLRADAMALPSAFLNIEEE